MDNVAVRTIKDVEINVSVILTVMNEIIPSKSERPCEIHTKSMYEWKYAGNSLKKVNYRKNRKMLMLLVFTN